MSRQTFASLHGETRFPADPTNYGEYAQIEDSSNVTRLGLRHSLTDHSEVRGLLSHQQTDQTNNWEWISNTLPYSTLPPFFGPTLPFPQTTTFSNSKARSAELQYRHSGAGYATQWGTHLVRSPLYVSSFGTSAVTNIAQQIYVDWQQVLNPYWQLEAGLAWGRNDKDWSAGGTSLRRWLPKLGMVYTPDSTTHVRLAAWQGLDTAAAGNAALAPVSLAGFLLHRPSDTYKLVESVALGADRQLDAAWLLEGRTQRRWTSDPYFYLEQQTIRKQADEARLALHWQPGNHPLSVTTAYDDERARNDSDLRSSDSVQEQRLRSLRLDMRWFATAQWTANLAWSHNRIAAIQQSSDTIPNPVLLDIGEHYNQTDASLSWQFNRAGAMDIGVRNATDRSFQYTETDPLIPRFSKGRLWYAKFKLAW